MEMKKKTKKESRKMSRIYKLRNKEVKASYQKRIEEIIQNKIYDIKQINMELQCSIFKRKQRYIHYNC